MRFVHHIAARTLVWLAAIAMPLQGVQTSACGCTNSSTQASNATHSGGPARCCGKPTTGACPCTGAELCRCGKDSSCCQPKASCCSTALPKCSGASCCHGRSCCSGGSEETSNNGCSCGDNCQCGQSDSPSQPSTPPAEDTPTERVLLALTMPSAPNGVALSLPERCRFDFLALAASLPAVDRCVSLCRFTL
ncbi:hypothetical protein Spa11_19900 [Botrimarina mediterranea]|uniref:Uncharacterized protein n=1 Tax=Botrimarina mediterranea TaxID=2528022 RepID=A0A518K7L4_9BACT|nr:hypothetical protein Spa11_19900 [Botrimarina mediterranea]